MTIKEFQVSLENKIKDLTIFSKPLAIAAISTTGEMSSRIFDKGLKTDESKISNYYSQEPIYVNPEKLTVKKSIGVLAGKTGEKVFKSGKKKGQPHKTKYLEGGYEELRNKVGRRTDIVDLKFSGELRMDFNNGEVAQPRKINELEYQIRLDKPINQDKRGGMEKKYGEIFTPSENEKKIFFDVIGFEFRKALSK